MADALIEPHNVIQVIANKGGCLAIFLLKQRYAVLCEKTHRSERLIDFVCNTRGDLTELGQFICLYEIGLELV